MPKFSDLVLSSPRRLAIPILTFPGAALVGGRVRDAVTKADCQVAAVRALSQHFELAVWQSGMDLSVEAEDFGAKIQFHDDETPTVIGRLVEDRAAIDQLDLPKVGLKRSRLYLEAISQLAADDLCPLALGGMIGPFSLAGRLFGLTELLMASIMEAELVTALLEKTCQYLIAYAKAQKAAGAGGTMIAEPSAGLLSPEALAVFSSAYVKRIVTAVQDDQFQVILHNCAANVSQLAAIYSAGAAVYHFGSTMNLAQALAAAPHDIIVCGNLDPVRVFCAGGPDLVASAAQELLASCGGYPNFVLSSGCDLPATVPLDNVAACFAAVRAVS